jgi:hypothetical protein
VQQNNETLSNIEKKKHPFGNGKEGTKREDQNSTKRQHPSMQKHI